MKNVRISRLTFIIFSSILCCTACKKKEAEEPIPPPYESFSSLEWVWSSLESAYFDDAIIIGVNSHDNILLYKYKQEASLFELVDAQTGKVIWSWNSFIDASEEATPFFGRDDLNLQNDILTFITTKAIYTIDAIKGTRIRTHKIDTIIVKGVAFDASNELYITYQHKFANDYKAHVVKTNINTLNWNYLFSVDDSTDKYTQHRLSVGKNKNGENMLMLSQSLTFFGSMVHGYNLNSNKIDWTSSLEGQPYGANSNFHYHEQKLFALNFVQTGVCKIVCININDGNKLWETRYAASYRHDNRLYSYNNHLIYVDDGIYCLNTQTGSTLRSQKFSISDRNYLVTSQFNNYLLFGIGKRLHIFNIPKMELVYNQIATFPTYEYMLSPFVHHKKKQLYFIDGHGLQCFKTPSIIH
jgi:outer membrane protein assembly factor BamB